MTHSNRLPSAVTAREKDGASDREECSQLRRAKIALDNALEGLYDARHRGDQKAFTFYQQALVIWCDAVKDWSTRIEPKKQPAPSNLKSSTS